MNRAPACTASSAADRENIVPAPTKSSGTSLHKRIKTSIAPSLRIVTSTTSSPRSKNCLPNCKTLDELLLTTIGMSPTLSILSRLSLSKTIQYLVTRQHHNNTRSECEAVCCPNRINLCGVITQQVTSGSFRNMSETYAGVDLNEIVDFHLKGYTVKALGG